MSTLRTITTDTFAALTGLLARIDRDRLAALAAGDMLTVATYEERIVAIELFLALRERPERWRRAMWPAPL